MAFYYVLNKCKLENVELITSFDYDHLFMHRLLDKTIQYINPLEYSISGCESVAKEGTVFLSCNTL